MTRSPTDRIATAIVRTGLALLWLIAGVLVVNLFVFAFNAGWRAAEMALEAMGR